MWMYFGFCFSEHFLPPSFPTYAFMLGVHRPVTSLTRLRYAPASFYMYIHNYSRQLHTDTLTGAGYPPDSRILYIRRSLHHF